MTLDQYEFLMEALNEDLESVRKAYESGELNGEHADYQERRIFDEMAEVELEWQSQHK